jgi:cytosine/adenosine deaminase-related metal-dependent hydrolase
MRRGAISLKARYVFPVEGPPIADGVVAVEGGRIAWVGPAAERAADLDLGDVAIIPGLVNAHTHLELSRMPGDDGPAPGESQNEIEWLREMTLRRLSGAWKPVYADNVKRNLASTIEAGTTLVGDITTAGLSWGPIAAAPARGVVFAEVIGLKRHRGLITSGEAWKWLGSIDHQDQIAANARPGLSPHAPYSTAGWLYHNAAGSRLPLTTHLAETPEELRLLEHRDGPLRGFLEEVGAWDDEWEPIGPRPADYIRKGELRDADWLVAHGTYIEPSDFWRFQPQASIGDRRVAIAFCPRTNARFGHHAHPYRTLLAKGAIVCLGTDSLASSPTLGVLDEMRFLHARDGSLSGELLLTMATLFGAWALRAETAAGSLRPGKSADLAVVRLPNRDEADPHMLLLESDLPVVATMFEGDFVAGSWQGI